MAHKERKWMVMGFLSRYSMKRLFMSRKKNHLILSQVIKQVYLEIRMGRMKDSIARPFQMNLVLLGSRSQLDMKTIPILKKKHKNM